MTHQTPPPPVAIQIPRPKDRREIDRFRQIIVPVIPALRPQNSAIMAMKTNYHPNAKFVALNPITIPPLVAPTPPHLSQFGMIGMMTMNGIKLIDN